MYKKKNTWKKEKEKKENTGVMAQIQYESAEHSPNSTLIMLMAFFLGK